MPLPPRHILLAAFGSYGDLFPFLGLGQALATAGHKVTVATHAHYATEVVQAGLQFAPVRPDLPEDAGTRARFMNPRRGSEYILKEFFAPAVDDIYADLERAATGVDLIVSQPLVLAAPLLAAKKNLPWLSTVLQPMVLFSAYDPPYMPPAPFLHGGKNWQVAVNRQIIGYARKWTESWLAPVLRLRQRLSLPDSGHPLYDMPYSPLGTLALFPPVMGQPQPDWPPRTVQTGAIAYSPPGASMPEEVAAFLQAGPPPLVFTLGTAAVHRQGDFYRMASIATEQLGERAILLGDHGTDPLPKGQLRCAYLPFHLIFPRARAIIHSSGIGTCMAALSARRPQLVVPMAHDQNDNARRLTRQGLALTLPFTRLSQRRLTATLRELLARDPAFIPPLPDGRAAAVALIEQVLAA